MVWVLFLALPQKVVGSLKQWQRLFDERWRCSEEGGGFPPPWWRETFLAYKALGEITLPRPLTPACGSHIPVFTQVKTMIRVRRSKIRVAYSQTACPGPQSRLWDSGVWGESRQCPRLVDIPIPGSREQTTRGGECAPAAEAGTFIHPHLPCGPWRRGDPPLHSALRWLIVAPAGRTNQMVPPNPFLFLFLLTAIQWAEAKQ